MYPGDLFCWLAPPNVYSNPEGRSDHLRPVRPRPSTLDLPSLQLVALPSHLLPPRCCHSSTPDQHPLHPLLLPPPRSTIPLQRESHPSITLPSRPRSLASHWSASHRRRSASPRIHGNPPQICLPSSGSAKGTGARSLASLWSLSLNNGLQRLATDLTLRHCLPLPLSPAVSLHLSRAQFDSDSTPSLAKLVILVIGPSLRANVSISYHLLEDLQGPHGGSANDSQTLPPCPTTTWGYSYRPSSMLRTHQHAMFLTRHLQRGTRPATLNRYVVNALM